MARPMFDFDGLVSAALDQYRAAQRTEFDYEQIAQEFEDDIAETLEILANSEDVRMLSGPEALRRAAAILREHL